MDFSLPKSCIRAQRADINETFIVQFEGMEKAFKKNNMDVRSVVLLVELEAYLFRVGWK